MLRLTTYLTLFWAVTLPFFWPEDASFFYYRMQLTMLTGIISFGYMAAAMLLAIRPAWLERRLNGLDKMYRLHKQLGIGTLVALSAHWFIVNSGKWLVQSGVLERPARAGGMSQPIVESINWKAVAESVGEWAFYLFLIFAAVSLIRVFTYKKFVAVHKLAGVIFLAGAFHSVALLKFSLTAEFMPYNIAVIAMTLVGSYCAWLSLTGKIGKSKKVNGQVIKTQRFQGNAVNFLIKLDSGIDYKSGQFVYLDFHDGEAPHPFTVVHYDNGNKTLEIAVKALGDYTTHMVEHLREGLPVEVEGGYGQFLLSGQKKQVWVGAGIGITPFVAWLESMDASRHSGIEKIVFFYCAKNKLEAFFAQRLQSLSDRISNLELHILLADEGQLLTPEEIMRSMGNETDYSVSFCGPAPFAESLKQGLATSGWPKEQFHNELFSMR